MSKIVYYSETGQTRQFVQKVNTYQALEISMNHCEFEVEEPFILVMPSYETNVHPVVIDTAADFLEYKNNLHYCKGLFGGGNRNFGHLFAVTAKTLAVEYDLPLLHCFEFQGSDKDLEKLNEEMTRIDKHS